MVARGGESRQHMTPAIPEFRKAMHQHNERPLALFSYMHPYSVDLKEPVVHFARSSREWPNCNRNNSHEKTASNCFHKKISFLINLNLLEVEHSGSP